MKPGKLWVALLACLTLVLLAGCDEASTMGGGLPKKTLGSGRSEKTIETRLRRLQLWCDAAVELYGDHGVLVEFLADGCVRPHFPLPPGLAS